MKCFVLFIVLVSFLSSLSFADENYIIDCELGSIDENSTAFISKIPKVLGFKGYELEYACNSFEEGKFLCSSNLFYSLKALEDKNSVFNLETSESFKMIVNNLNDINNYPIIKNTMAILLDSGYQNLVCKDSEQVSTLAKEVVCTSEEETDFEFKPVYIANDSVTNYSLTYVDSSSNHMILISYTTQFFPENSLVGNFYDFDIYKRGQAGQNISKASCSTAMLTPTNDPRAVIFSLAQALLSKAEGSN